MNENINILRMQIDSIDDEIIKLLDKRFKICKYISKEKKLQNKDIYDLQRENEIITRLEKLNTKYITNESKRNIYKEILRNSVMKMKNNI